MYYIFYSKPAMNLQQQEHFYQMMTRVKMNSRAASSPHARITEMVNGLLVSKPAKKEPVVIDLQEYATSGKAAASVPGINKIKEIHEFSIRGYM